ncbi:YkgJ family cysteine cluster protein [Nitrospira moscoviensis]|uniref:YkgJ family cysteine cluster protein n=1 Tax=Nitrospira moscoviensis TaxID=42253 RepID=A0A0K2GIM8_NITMO|nr:YkgJ family cysteine cluster protein [Nitrospira moscoviensis]ALA60724.1 hypothetical protein NITMOv2_4348 [Nitrospira moscoviensis]
MPPSSAPFRLFEQTAHWFARARAALLDELPCRPGCHRCCIGLFPVTLLDREAIKAGLSSLPSATREAIVDTAARQAGMIAAAVPRLAESRCVDQWPDADLDALAEQYRDLPCPALQKDGSCGVYAFRPLACRSMGIPIETDGIVQGACEVQTSVPLVRLSSSFRREEDLLAEAEAEQLAALRRKRGADGDELLLPFAFLP